MSAEGRVVVVDGVRTPFCAAAGELRALSALQLGQACVAELLARTGVARRRIDRVVFGRVIPSLDDFNVAREIVLGTELLPQTDAYSVSQACITSYRAVTNAAAAIATGEIDCAIAGGTDSASDVPVGVSRPLAHALTRASRARSLRARVAAFTDVSPTDLRPRSLEVAEPSTGLTMGESTEKMAKENDISRSDQDEFAHRSHQRASEAWAEGVFRDQVMTLYPEPDYEPVQRDGIVREDSDLAAYARLSPVFDKEHGTITAGNSSALTDGASAVLLMREDLARSEGLPILGRVGPWAYGGVDPRDQLLIGPAHVVPRLLARVGLQLADVDLFDLHEAFAAQVLSVLRAWESETFAREYLGRDGAVGSIDPERLNVSGGSIALGHPFAATGTRQIMQALHDLRRRGGERVLCSACAAGGLAAAMILEAP